MEIWKILGIEPTEDKKLIKKAYLAKLKVTHPEEKPEEFAILKEAYDLAQEFKFNEVEVKSEFLCELESLYDNFEKRIKVENWVELFNKHLEKDKVSLESLVNSNVEILREELLVFAMDKYYFTHEIWTLIEKEFNIIFYREELCRKFPENFIDFVISHIKYGPTFQFKYLELDGNKNYELFIEKSVEVSNLLKGGALKSHDGLVALKKLFDELDEMDIKYLINELNKATFLGVHISTESKIEKLLELAEEYKDETLPLKHLGYVYLCENNHKEAQNYYKTVLKREENDIQSMLWLIRSLIDTEDYLEAFQLIKDCFKNEEIEGYREIVYDYSAVVCAKLLDYHIKINEEENYSNIKSIKDLGYSYLVLSEYKKANEVYKKLDVSERDEKIYNNLLQSHLYDEDYEGFLQILDDYKTNVGEITGGEVAFCICQYYLIIEDYESCLNECDKFLSKSEDDISILEIKVEALFELQRYNEVIEIAKLILKKGHSNANITLKAAQSFMEQFDYFNALEYANIASSIEFYSVAIQRIRVESLYRIGHEEKAIQLQQHILETGLDDEVINLYASHSYYELEDYQAALDIINKEQSREEREKSLEYALLHASVLENVDELDEAVCVLESQIESQIENHIESQTESINDLILVSNLSRLYNMVETYEKAVELMKKTLLNGEEITVENLKSINYEDFNKNHNCTLHAFQSCVCRFAWILFRNYEEYYKEAIILFEKCKNSEIYFKYSYEIAYCYNEIGEKEKAITFYRLYIEKSGKTDFDWTYNNLINIYKDLKKTDEELIELYEEAIEACPDHQKLFNDYVLLLNKNGLYEKCIEIAEKVLNNQEITYFYEAHNEMWAAFVKLKKRDEFETYNKRFLERAKSEDIENKSYHLCNIAHTYIEDKNYNKALEILNFTEKYLYEKYGEDYDFTKGADDYVLSDLAKCHRRLGNEDLAKKYLDMCLIAIKSCSKCCFNYHKAFALTKYGDYENALKYAFKAEKTKVVSVFCDSAPLCRHAYQILGEIYAEMGEDKLAIEYYEKFLEYEFQLDILNEVERMKNK